MNDTLVSIIMPAYNCEHFIAETVESVFAQSYQNWELIIVDDCSTDKTAEIIKNYTLKDDRIKYFKNEKNSGAALSRNNAVNHASGRFLAFLDSDDLWKADKLTKQIAYMTEHDYAFTCTAYDKIDENSNALNRIITAERKSDYHGLLRKCPGNSTVIYDTLKLGKHTIPDIRKRNDYVMWLKIIKEAKYIHGMQEVLASHRVRTDSISAQKTSLVSYHWRVYRDIEKLSLLYSAYLVCYWIMKALLKK